MWALLIRDLTLAFRSGGGFGLAVAFFLILVIFVPFGIGSDRAILSLVAPGILWIGALLACLLSLDRIFQLDAEDGSLDILATSPLPLEGVALIKALAHWLTTGLPLTLAAAPLGYLLGLAPTLYPWLILSLAIGTLGLSIIGLFGAALTVGLKRGGLLLSVLVLPLYVPSLIFGVQVMVRSTNGDDPLPVLLMLTAVTLFALAAIPFATAMALRANLR